VSFSLPTVNTNATGWGPAAGLVPPRFQSVPFAQYNKSDRLGKCADFGGFSRYNTRRYVRAGDDNAELTYRYDVGEEKEFSRVEARGKVVSAVAAVPVHQHYTRGGGRGGSWGGGGGRGGAGAGGGGGGGRGGGSAGGTGSKGYDDRGARSAGRKASTIGSGGRGGRDDRGGRGGYGRGGYGGGGMRRGPGGGVTREASVNVTPDWLLLETVELSQLAKLSTAAPPAEDLRWAGSLEAYDEEFDRINSKTPRRLKQFDQLDFYYHSTNEDPILQELAQQVRAPREAAAAIAAAAAQREQCGFTPPPLTLISLSRTSRWATSTRRTRC